MWDSTKTGVNRHAEWRKNEAQILSLQAQENLQLLLFDETGRVLFDDRSNSPVNGDDLWPPHLAREWIFLGVDEQQSPWFSGQLNGDKLSPQKHCQWLALRTLLPVLDSAQCELLSHAKALHYWHQTQGYCSRCGSPSDIRSAGHEVHCAHCNTIVFPRTDPAVIMAITHQDRLLLARDPRWPDTMYSVLAGFVEPGESFEQCVCREVEEEVGLQLDNINYKGSQPWPFPHSIMIGFQAEAKDTQMTRQEDEIEDAIWVTAEELHTHLRQGKITLPEGGAISYTLIADWAAQFGISC